MYALLQKPFAYYTDDDGGLWYSLTYVSRFSYDVYGKVGFLLNFAAVVCHVRYRRSRVSLYHPAVSKPFILIIEPLASAMSDGNVNGLRKET